MLIFNLVLFSHCIVKLSQLHRRYLQSAPSPALLRQTHSRTVQVFILYLLHCGELPFQLSVYCFFSDLLTKRLSVFIPANEAACLRVSIIRKRKDTLCSAQITCNYHPPSPPFILDFSQTVATETQHVEMHLNSYFFSAYIWAESA